MESKSKRTPLEEFKKSYIYEIILNPFKLNNLLFNKYGDIEEDFNLLYLDAILYSKNCHFAVKYREYLIWDYVDEFLKRYYTNKESEERLPRIANYYKNYLKFFCNPFFKDMKKNELIQVYGDDKAKIYYKNNYGNYNKALAAMNKNIGNDKNENQNEINATEDNNNGNNDNNNKDDFKSVIFNTTVRGNIDNNVITRSSVNTRNENSKNYDSFFDSSFSKLNNADSKKNFWNSPNSRNSLGLGNKYIYNKEKNNKKNVQESFIDLLKNVDEHSFTFDYILEENSFYLKTSAPKDNFDIKTSFISSNKIKAKRSIKNNTNFNPKANSNAEYENKINNFDENFNQLKNKNNFVNLNPWQNNQVTTNQQNDLNLNAKNKSIYLKEQISDQSKYFKKIYNDLLKNSTNKLLEKHNILTNLNQINSNNANLNHDLKKNSKEKNISSKAGKSNNNAMNLDNLKFALNKKENQQIPNKDIKRTEISVSNNQERKLEKKVSSNNKNNLILKNNFHTIDNEKNREINKRKEENKTYNIKNSTNNYNIEGSNNVVINISPRMDVDFNDIQNFNNMDNNMEISPEKLLYNISNRVGSPIMNSIVNINIKPILQVNNNQSNVNIYNSNSNAIKNEKRNNENSEAALAHTIKPSNKKKDSNLVKTKFLEFKNNKVSQNKTKRISSLSNNSNKSREIGKKLSHMTNNILYENQLNALNLNFSLSKNQLLCSVKNPNNPNIIIKNSVSQSGRVLKMIKENFDTGKRSQLKTKSFDRNSSQANFLLKIANCNFKKLKSSNMLNKNSTAINKFEFCDNYENKANSKEELSYENNLKEGGKISNIQNHRKFSNLNQDFNNFTNEINKKLLNNFNSDKGLDLLATGKNKQKDKLEAEEKNTNIPRKIRLGSDDFKNQMMNSLQKANEKLNKNLEFKSKHKMNISEDNLKKFIKISNTLANSKETSINSNCNLISNNDSNIINTQFRQYQKELNSPDQIEDLDKLNLNETSKKNLNCAFPINSENILNFSSNNKRQAQLGDNNHDKLNNNGNDVRKLIRSNSKLNLINNKVCGKDKNKQFNNDENLNLNLKYRIDQDNTQSTQQLNSNHFKFGDFQKNFQDIISNNMLSAVNRFKTNNNKSSNLETNEEINNLDKHTNLNHNSSFKDKIEDAVNNTNNEKSSRIIIKTKSNKNLTNAVFTNLSNTKLNNYLLHSNNLASLSSQSQINPNILSNNSSNNYKNSTVNYQLTNSIKVSNSIQTNKIENSQSNFNSIKILNTMTKGNLLNNANKESLNQNKLLNNSNVGNKKSISIEKANNLSKKKISILKNSYNNNNNSDLNNNNHQNFKMKIIFNNNLKNHKNNSESKDHKSYGSTYNFSHSPNKNKTENFVSDQNNLILGSHSRNKSNAIFKLNTNPSNHSKIKDRVNHSDNKSISVQQGAISNEKGGILNMKLFDYIKNQEYVDLLKETMEYNNNQKYGENANITKTAFNSSNYNKHVKNNKSVNLNFNKNLSKDSKKANSKTSSMINNLNGNFLEKSDNLNSNFNFSKFDKYKSNSKEKMSESKRNFEITTTNKINNLNSNINKNFFGNMHLIRELNDGKRVKLNLKSEVSKANNFMNNKPLNNNSKLNENSSKRKTTNTNSDIWINNPYIINSNKIIQGKSAEKNFDNTDNMIINKKIKTSKNRSIDANIFLNNKPLNIIPGKNNTSGSKFYESSSKNKDK